MQQITQGQVLRQLRVAGLAVTETLHSGGLKLAGKPLIRNGGDDGTRDALPQFSFLHSPFGVQSWTTVVAGFDDGWRMSTMARRCWVPVAVRCIDKPS